MKNSSEKQSKLNVWFWAAGIIIFIIIAIILGNNKTTSQLLSSTENKTNQISKTEIPKEILYKIFSTEDLSMKALGNKLLSQYSTSEIQDLPMDKRFSYDVLVARNISEADLLKVAEKVVSDTRKKDNDIDELILNFYDDEKEKTPTGKATWAPNGEWGLVSPEIARSNSRSLYKIELSYFEFSKGDDSNKMDDKEREIYDFYFDNFTRLSKEKGPDADTTRDGEIYKWIVNEIKNKYSISEDELEKILYKDR